MLKDTNHIKDSVKKSQKNFDNKRKETSIILAAGHGKRIKSKTSKMLHEIWGKPTVERVYEASKHALDNGNIIVVVGIKAADVIKAVGEKEHTSYAYQEVQNGTGHAVQVALENIDETKYDGIVYVLPGDMGLIDKSTLSKFRQNFIESGKDMMVLTGLYQGLNENNNYGRIVRVKARDIDGNISGSDEGNVIEIIEFNDIQKLNPKEPYILEFKNRKYSFTKEELIENNEFNSGVYAFKFKYLASLIKKISSDNAQNEIYITDLIAMFNKNGLTVGAVHPNEQHVLMGFNNKSVLKEMETIARHKAYEQLKDIIEIEDPEDFFIHDDVLEQIIELDSEGQPLDIKIGKGVFLGKGAKLNYNLTIHKNVRVEGNIFFGRNVRIWENAHLSTFEHQQFVIHDNVEIFWNDIIKGNIIIGKNSRIESSVNMTGSDEHPLRIGENVVIKGTSYLFGSIVGDNMHIEHSVLIRKRIEKTGKNYDEVEYLKFYLPKAEGTESISEL